MFILYTYYYNASGSGIIGIIIIALVYGAVLVINTFIFYNYLLFLHMEGRLIDIFARVTADTSYFFIPLDNEVSERYLRWVIAKVKIENNALNNELVMGSKQFSITYHTVTDPVGDYRKELSHISIYRKREDGKLVLYRHFVKTGDGAICELEEGVPFTVDEHPFLEIWPEHTRKFLGSQTPSVMEGEGGKTNGPDSKDPQEEIPGTYRLMIGGDSTEGKKEASPYEPQVVLIKNQ